VATRCEIRHRTQAKDGDEYPNSDRDGSCASGVPTIDDAWCEDERNKPATVGDKAWKVVIHVGEPVNEVSQ
jgi:hypothetical protein